MAPASPWGARGGPSELSWVEARGLSLYTALRLPVIGWKVTYRGGIAWARWLFSGDIFLKKIDSPRKSGGPLYPLQIEFFFTSPMSLLPFVLGQLSWIEGYILYIVGESLRFTMPGLALDMLNGSYENLENCFVLKNVWLITNYLGRKCYFEFEKLTYNLSFFFVALL